MRNYLLFGPPDVDIFFLGLLHLIDGLIAVVTLGMIASVFARVMAQDIIRKDEHGGL